MKILHGRVFVVRQCSSGDTGAAAIAPQPSYEVVELHILVYTVHPTKNAPIRKIGASHAACSVAKILA